jgi:hypothetical protein
MEIISINRQSNVTPAIALTVGPVSFVLAAAAAAAAAAVITAWRELLPSPLHCTSHNIVQVIQVQLHPQSHLLPTVHNASLPLLPSPAPPSRAALCCDATFLRKIPCSAA